MVWTSDASELQNHIHIDNKQSTGKGEEKTVTIFLLKTK